MIKEIATYVGATVLCAGFFLVAYVAVPAFLPTNYETKSGAVAVKSDAEIAPKKKTAHIVTPSPLKAIYMTQCVVGTKPFREKLVKIIDDTEINSVVIDIKDYTGRIAFDTDHPLLSHAISDKCGASDMEEFIARLHEKGVYVIGRVTVFQDPYMVKTRPDLAVQSKSTGTVWKDFKGLSFIDVGAREHWDYIVALAQESYAIGFDEINFDYIRFPSDGKMDDVLYVHSAGKNKPQALREFFAYLHDKLKDTGLVTSADLFGMTTTNSDDLNIGQVLESTLPYFDYIAPMVYPSHYPKNFNGWKNPNEHIYEIVYMSMKSAVERGEALDEAIAAVALPSQEGPTASTTSTTVTAVAPPETAASTAIKAVPEWYRGDSASKLRTWIQDFDYGGNYDVAEVKAQIQASVDAGVDSWMIWSPSNNYTLGALLPK